VPRCNGYKPLVETGSNCPISTTPYPALIRLDHPKLVEFKGGFVEVLENSDLFLSSDYWITTYTNLFKFKYSIYLKFYKGISG